MPFTPRPASPFVVLLCLTSDDFTCQGKAFAWGRVIWAISLPHLLFVILFCLTGPSVILLCYYILIYIHVFNK